MKNKSWKNGIKLWKKIGRRVRIRKEDDMFNIEIRDVYRPHWRVLHAFVSDIEALYQKHYIIRTILYKEFDIYDRYKKKRYAK